jgi:O-antigen/teichoic acid export membrane protein
MISKSFLKSSVIFTIGGSLPMLAGLILLPFYTNFLSDVHYTQVLFYISMSLLFQILFSFSIESYFGIRYTQLSGDLAKQKKFIGTVSVLLLIIGAGLLMLTAVFGNLLFNTIYKPDLQMEFWPYGFYSVITGFFNSYFKASSICLMYLKQAKLYLIANVINFIFTLLISIAGLYIFPNSIVGPIYGRLISGLVIFLIGHYIFSRNGELILDRSFLNDLVKFCRPFVFYVLSIWVLGQIDRYFLQAYISKTDLNTYDLVLKCFFGIEFVQNSLFGIINPKIYEIWNKNEVHSTTPDSNRYFNVFTAINIMQLLVFCIVLPFIYKLLIKNTAFYQSEVYIGILAAGYALRSIHLYYLATILFSKKINVLLRIFGCSAAIQVAMTLFAVKYFGLEGAIYAGLITKMLQVILCIGFTRSIFIYNYNYFKIIGIPLIYFTINLLQFVIFKEYNLWMYVAQLLLFSIILYFVFRNEIKKVLVNFKLLPSKV